MRTDILSSNSHYVLPGINEGANITRFLSLWRQTVSWNQENEMLLYVNRYINCE